MSFPQVVQGMPIILGKVSPGAVHCRYPYMCKCVCVCVHIDIIYLLVWTAFFFSLDAIKPVIINIDSDKWKSV